MIPEPFYAVVRSGRKMYTKRFCKSMHTKRPSKSLGCCEGNAGHEGLLSTGCYAYTKRLFKSLGCCEVDAVLSQSNAFSSSSGKSRQTSSNSFSSDGGICFSCFGAAGRPGAVFGKGCNAVRGEPSLELLRHLHVPVFCTDYCAFECRRPCPQPVEGVVVLVW